MNHPEDRSKLEVASGAAIRASRTTVWRQELQRDGVKQGEGWVLPQGMRDALHTPAALGWLQGDWLLGGLGVRDPSEEPGWLQPGGRLWLRVPGLDGC